MKKFYFLLAAVMIGLTANADWYLRGDFNHWGTSDKFTQVGDKFVLENVTITASSKMKVDDGNWGTSYGEWDGYAKNMTGGNQYKCHKGGGDMSFGGSDFTGNVEFWIDGTDGWAYISFVSKGGETPVTPDPTTYTVSYDNGKTAWGEVYVYMWNGANNNAAWPGVKMSLTEPGSTVWEYSVDLTWKPEGIIFNNGNGAQTDDLDFTNGGEYGEAADPVVIAVWALVGADDDYIGVPVTNDEEYIEDYGFSPVVDGVATFVVENWNCEGFFLMEQNLTALSGAELYTSGTELANGVAVTLAEGVDAMTLPEDAKGKTVTFTYNVNTKKLTASWAAPHYVYLMGINGDWGNGIKAEVSTETNCATWTINGWVEGTGFKVKDGDNWYGYTGTIENGGWYEMGETGLTNITLPTEANGKNVTITFAADNQNFSVTWKDASAIESIEAVAGAARYFNLQGVEVANPVNGNVYIKVVDGKASKVLVK